MKPLIPTTTLLFLFCLVNGQTFYHTGNEDPVETNHLPGLVLAGGSTDNNDAMRWMLERADGGDVVVLRASGSDGYNNYFYSTLGVEINSVTSIVITSSEQADNEAVLEALSNAEVVFIAGGNQWNYVNYWRGTQMLELLNGLIHEKQITIGGTSAGMAVLGEVVFSAQNGTVWSSQALENPYHHRLTLEKDFLDVPFMEQTVTDSHYNRVHGDNMVRHGRHVAFMARMVPDWDMVPRGIAANEYTAVAVDEEGRARVFGHPAYPDYAYFLQQHGGTPEVIDEGIPLTWDRDQQAIRVYEIKGDYDGSGWFDLADWETGEGGQWQYWYVIDGELYQEDIEDDTGADDLSEAGFSVNLYPNPACSHLTIRITRQAGPLKATLRTMDGTFLENRQIDPDTNQEVRVDVGHLPAGVYLLELSDGRQTVVKQWVKLGRR